MGNLWSDSLFLFMTFSCRTLTKNKSFKWSLLHTKQFYCSARILHEVETLCQLFIVFSRQGFYFICSIIIHIVQCGFDPKSFSRQNRFNRQGTVYSQATKVFLALPLTVFVMQLKSLWAAFGFFPMFCLPYFFFDLHDSRSCLMQALGRRYYDTVSVCVGPGITVLELN